MAHVCKSLFLLFLFGVARQPFDTETKPGLNLEGIKKDSIVQRETAIIDGTRYTAVNILDDRFARDKFCIKDKNGKVVYTANEEQGVEGFKFVDFNEDGCKDVVLDLMVADSGEQDLVLYDPKSKKFVLAGNCSNAEKVANTKYFYSYQDCCAGRAWSSGLFYISGSKIINVGHIKYDDGYGLSFFKLQGKKKVLIEKWRVRINGDTPVTTGPHIDFDLGHYWRKHWRRFGK